MKISRLINHKLFIKSISFYSIVVLLPLFILGYANFYFSLKLIDEKNNEIFESMLSKTQNSIDTKMNSINNLTTSLLNNSRIEKVLYDINNTKQMDMLSNLEYYFAISELKQTCFYYDYIEGIALYINNSNTVLYSDGIHYFPEFINSTYNKKDLNFSDFLSDCTRLSDNLYYSLPDTLTLNYKKSNVLTVIKTFSDNGSSFHGAFLIFIDFELFNELLPSSDQYSDISATLTDDRNNLIAGNLYLYDKNKDMDYNYGKGIIKDFSIDNISYNMFYKKLDNMPWNLAIYVPANSESYFYGYTKWYTVIFVIFIFIGLIISSLISYRSYKPVNDIMKTIITDLNNNNKTIMPSSDEYKFIETNLSNMNHTVVSLRNSASYYRSLVRDMYLLRLLKNSDLSKNESIKTFELLDVDLKNTIFLACAAYLLYPGDNPSDNSDNTSVEDLKILKDSLCTIKNIGVFAIKEVNNRAAILIYWSKSSVSESEPGNQYDEIINTINKYISEQTLKGKKAYVGVGSMTFSGDEICNSYVDAGNSLTLSILINSSQAVEYISVEKYAFEPFYYPLELEADILKALKSGDYLKIKSILSMVYEKNLKEKVLCPISAHCLFYELYATLIKGRKILFEKNTNEINAETIKLISISDLIEQMNFEFEYLCLEYAIKSPEDKTAALIKEFIDKNYKNASLSLNYVAGIFQVSPYYVSRLFQSDTEAGFLDYINTKRIQFAVQLLKNEEYPITEVSKISGFSNQYTFSRVFKRYTGTTPGNFRQIKTNIL